MARCHGTPARQVWVEAQSRVCAHPQRAVLGEGLPAPTRPLTSPLRFWVAALARPVALETVHDPWCSGAPVATLRGCDFQETHCPVSEVMILVLLDL